jgi:hypothetical protein
MGNLIVNADIMKKSPTKRTANHYLKLYMTLAISIRIIGLQQRPLQNRQNSRPLRDAIDEAYAHFLSRDIDVSLGGKRVYYSLVSVPLFTIEYTEDISSNFQKLVRRLGQFCAGDEKLFHFTGNSGDIRLVITKPDKVGFWFYELCAPLCYGGSFLLWTKLHHVEEISSIGVPVSSVVRSWIEAMQRLQGPGTILTTDSYYLDSTGRELLKESGLKYIASITSQRFKQFFDILGPKVQRPREWAGLFNPETSESVVYYYSCKNSIQKKMVISNVFRKIEKKTSKQTVPIYTHYKFSFAACDEFNKGLGDRSWPHKKGGRNCPGDRGCQHDFMLSCILQNVFNSYRELSRRSTENISFMDLCLILADEIHTHCQTIV